jgi:hypothetical protein
LLGRRAGIGMKMSTCLPLVLRILPLVLRILPLVLRILPSAPLAFKKNNYGGTSPMIPRMGCRPYEPRYFHPKVVATGHERLLRPSRKDSRCVKVREPRRPSKKESWQSQGLANLAN